MIQQFTGMDLFLNSLAFVVLKLSLRMYTCKQEICIKVVPCVPTNIIFHGRLSILFCKLF